jgi:tripartite-type tricarboxylate transporter receptor subunit TctC
MNGLPRRAVLAALGALSLSGAAQQWPERPVRLIVPYRAGGLTDLLARALAARLALQTGRAVLVENRVGASGTIGMEMLAKSPSDGYTLAFSAITALTLAPALGRVPYDPDHDFTPVASVMLSPVLVLATRALGVRDFTALLQRARDFPDAVRWATSGLGSLGHLMLEELQLEARTRMVHVPYTSGAQQVTDAIGAHFEVLAVNAGPALGEPMRLGQLRALAVGAPRRIGTLPQVPTLGELGFPGANLASHFGVFAPGQLPLRVADRINGEVNAALASVELRERMLLGETLATGGTPREFARQIAAESGRTTALLRALALRE